MIWIHPDDVIIPENRYRREFDEKRLGELRDSISRNGLLHPITVERSPDDKFILRAGERRFRVTSGIVKSGGKIRCGDVEQALIPAVEFALLTPMQRLEVEVEENTIRLDFDWKERTKALADLHELRQKQNPGQTLKDTATEVIGRPAVGDQISRVSAALVIKKHLNIPEVAAAKNEKDALKVIRKISEAGHRAKLAEKFDVSRSVHKLLKGSAIDLLPTLPEASFDVICTDPPYGIDADNFGTQSAEGHDYEDSQKYWETLMGIFCDESFRITKPRAHAYVFCDPRRFDRLAILMVLAGWEVFPTPLIWSKGNGMLPLPDHGPRRTYEAILYAYKGGRKTLAVKADVIDKIPPVRNLKHGAQKPVAVYIDLLSRSANPGDTVLDCFGGTGPILVAANRMRLTATYIEQAEAAFNVALERLNQKEIDDGAVEDDGLGDVQV